MKMYKNMYRLVNLSNINKNDTLSQELTFRFILIVNIFNYFFVIAI